MLTRLLTITLAAALIPGCAFLGGKSAENTEPSEDLDPVITSGRHFRLVVENTGPHPISVRFQVFAPGGSFASEGSDTVEGGGSSLLAVAQPGVGDHRVEFTYNWTADGRAGSGANDIVFNTRDCDGIVEVQFTGDTTPDASGSQVSTTCKPST